MANYTQGGSRGGHDTHGGRTPKNNDSSSSSSSQPTVKSYKTAEGQTVYVTKTDTGSVSGTAQEVSGRSSSGTSAVSYRGTTEEQKKEVQRQEASQPIKITVDKSKSYESQVNEYLAKQSGTYGEVSVPTSKLIQASNKILSKDIYGVDETEKRVELTQQQKIATQLSGYFEKGKGNYGTTIQPEKYYASLGLSAPKIESVSQRPISQQIAEKTFYSPAGTKVNAVTGETTKIPITEQPRQQGTPLQMSSQMMNISGGFSYVGVGGSKEQAVDLEGGKYLISQLKTRDTITTSIMGLGTDKERQQLREQVAMRIPRTEEELKMMKSSERGQFYEKVGEIKTSIKEGDIKGALGKTYDVREGFGKEIATMWNEPVKKITSKMESKPSKLDIVTGAVSPLSLLGKYKGAEITQATTSFLTGSAGKLFESGTSAVGKTYKLFTKPTQTGFGDIKELTFGAATVATTAMSGTPIKSVFGGVIKSFGVSELSFGGIGGVRESFAPTQPTTSPSAITQFRSQTKEPFFIKLPSMLSPVLAEALRQIARPFGYKDPFQEQLKQQGYTEQQIKDIRAGEKWSFAQEAVPFISGSAVIEKTGRSIIGAKLSGLELSQQTAKATVKGIVKPVLFKLGVGEAISQTRVSEQLYNQEYSPLTYGVSSLMGGYSAQIIGTPIATKQFMGTAGRRATTVLEGVSNIADYSEPLGDIGADIFSRTPEPTIRILTPSITPQQTPTQMGGATTWTTVTEQGATTRTLTEKQTKTLISLSPEVQTKTRTETRTPSTTRTLVQLPTLTETKTNIRTAITTRTEIKQPTQTSTRVSTLTSVRTDVFTPQIPMIPLFSGEWRGKGSFAEISESRKREYTPNILGLMSGQVLTKKPTGIFTGFEMIRPMVR